MELKFNEFITHPGRIVMGNPLEGFTTDYHKRPLVDRKTGQPYTDYAFNVAFEKSNPATQQLHDKIKNIAWQLMPPFFQQNGQPLNPNFAFKLIDGDSTNVDQSGKVINQKDGYAGHWVLKFSTRYAPTCFDKSDNVIGDPKSPLMETGNYVEIMASIQANTDQAKPGIFIAPFVVRFVGYGARIAGVPNSATIFGQQTAQLPNGCSSTPLSSGAAMPPVPGQPAAQQPPAAPGVPPVTPPAYQDPAAPQGAPPNYDFLKPPIGQAAGQQSPVPPTPPAAPPAPERYRASNGAEYDGAALRKAGWTEAQLATLTRI